MRLLLVESVCAVWGVCVLSIIVCQAEQVHKIVNKIH